LILVDTSVWIDYFRGTSNRESDRLDELLGQSEIAIGDLILAEVLQGFGGDAAFERARRSLAAFPLIEIGGADIAIQCARNFRALRARGITVRRTIDTFIATRCIVDGIRLLHRDRDFDPFESHLGLQNAL